MSISNLHSLFNRPWYIEQNYAQGHMPLVIGILTGNTLGERDDAKKKPSLVNQMAVSGGANAASTTVAVLSIKNPIVKHDQFCGPQGTKSMMRELDAIKGSESVAGVVLDIDSGGGQAYGTPEFYDYLMSYPKPVVAYTDGLMCSAAYYIGSAATEIVANKRAEHIGSIGAYSQLFDLDGFYEKQGVKIHTMYATKSTEKNKSYRDAMKGEEFYGSYIKEELDPLVDNFIADMQAARPNINSEVFKGATYSGEKALEMGLVDSLGTIDTAIQRVFELSEKQNPKSTQMSKSYPKIESFIGKTFAEGEAANGILLSETEAEAVESQIEALEGAAAKSEKATTDLQASIDAQTAAHDALVETANATLERTGNDATISVSDAFAAYETKIAELSAKPGATHTTTKKSEEINEGMPDYVDLDCSIYQIN